MVKKGLLIGIVNFFIGFGMNYLTGILFPSLQQEYQNSGIFRPWSDPLMMLFFAYPFIGGLVFAYLWSLIKDRIKGKSRSEKAMSFANIYFLIATIPGMFITYSSFHISLLMIAVWTVTGYVEAFAAGMVLAKK